MALLLLPSVALLLAASAEAFVPRSDVGAPGSITRQALARDAYVSHALTLEPDDASAPASHESEQRFSLHLAPDAFGLEQLRGQPDGEENSHRGEDLSGRETRIGGSAIFLGSRIGSEEHRTLGLHWACGLSTCELAEEQRFDPWGLCAFGLPCPGWAQKRIDGAADFVVEKTQAAGRSAAQTARAVAKPFQGTADIYRREGRKAVVGTVRTTEEFSEAGRVLHDPNATPEEKQAAWRKQGEIVLTAVAILDGLRAPAPRVVARGRGPMPLSRAPATDAPGPQGPFSVDDVLASEAANAQAVQRLGIPENLSPRQSLHTPPVSGGRSVLTEDAAELLRGLHRGDYPILRQPKAGQVVVDFGKPIGEYWSTASGQPVLVGPTNFGSVRWGNNGVHIVPASPTQW